jgi:nucleotide-binding universal stress UspA family protein
MIREINRILYATDLTDNAAYAFEYAAGLAKSLDAEIHVIHVVEALSDDQRVTLTLFIQNEKAREEALRRRVDTATELLHERQDKFWNSLDEAGQAVREKVASVRVIEGFPAESILHEAEALDCDMILIGAHAHGFSHTFLGSIAKRVLRRSTIPTFVVPFKDEL